MQETNPLQAWLDRQTVPLKTGTKAMTASYFARAHGFGTTNLYDFLAGRLSDMSSSMMQKIERATDGQVTVQMLSDWLREAASVSQPEEIT